MQLLQLFIPTTGLYKFQERGIPWALDLNQVIGGYLDSTDRFHKLLAPDNWSTPAGPFPRCEARGIRNIEDGAGEISMDSLA